MIFFVFFSCFIAIYASEVPLVKVPVTKVEVVKVPEKKVEVVKVPEKKVEVVKAPLVKVEKAQPYNFGYTIKDKESIQTRNEAGNAAGEVHGNYGIIDNKGILRLVNYVADKKGFRAQIKTNEPGTSGQSPADVKLISNDPYAQGAADPYLSRPNVPYVPAFYMSNPVKGLPTFKKFYSFVPDAKSYSDKQQGIVYYGGNVIGGKINGYTSRFVAAV